MPMTQWTSGGLALALLAALAGGATTRHERAPAPAPAPAAVPDHDYDDEHGSPQSPGTREVQRGLAMLQYVIGDYPASVTAEGVTQDASEYKEQIDLLAEVESALRAATGVRADSLADDVARLRDRARAHARPDEVTATARALHERIVKAFHIQQSPQQVPSLAGGRILFTQLCAQCHGEDGRAKTPRARELKPPPANFHARLLDHSLSPYQVFSVITFGLPKTGMASFETLEEEERWDLAFYVMALRHAGEPETPPPARVRLTLRDLARATDADLRHRLSDVPQAHRAGTVAALRRHLPIQVGD
jgi:high-affinity iron transporter